MPRRSVALIVEDQEDQRDLLALMAAKWGYQAETACDGVEALEKLGTITPDVIVTDVAMPRMDGLNLLREARKRGVTVPVIVITAYGDSRKAVSVVHDLGAFWFLEKPFDFEVLKELLDRATSHSALVRESEVLRRRLAYSGVLGDIIGQSPAMQRVFALVQQAASSNASVLISGESGTGKEIAAQTICKLSDRRNRPFVAVNCAALPESLVESELFGFEKGSFTGAATSRAGCFELAHGGTLLLDEIGEMPIAIQAKLLRVLENGRVRRLGSSGETEVDVRVLAATNRHPEEAVERGELRQDLYFRLNVFHVKLPPLRERKEDIPPLIDALIPDLNSKHSCAVTGVDAEVLQKMAQHPWPGNVRELRNILERAVILARQGSITTAHLSEDFLGVPQRRVAVRTDPAPSAPPSDDSVSIPLGATVADMEKQLILRTLDKNQGNRTRTARMLGISVRTLQKRLNEYAVPDEHSHKEAAG